MKKITILFVLFAVLAAFGTVFAQAGAPLDMTVAEPFLGTWFMSELCGQGQCMDAAVLGMSGMSVVFKDEAAEVAEVREAVVSEVIVAFDVD